MKRALLVIDVQYEYFTGRMPITYPEGSFENIIKAVDAANLYQIPVILIRHTAIQNDAATFRKGSHNWEIHEDLLKKEHVCIIDKNLPGSFTDTDLENMLKQMSIDTIVIAGYMTQMCCDTTARQAVHLGLSVEFLSDATGTLDIMNYAGKVTGEELHRSILVTQAMRFSRVISTDEWIKDH
ncbi:streptothricin hydrolase [Desulfosporosinus acididurans]|uniref:Streptothricin hydrolase n=1 Tax=Desulfosporosinus acididurans TaxID=476652 RepID=A0A0J1FK16_9FIRM|nr:cysteine hydrolase family protein [Desulfosporosinus acididurans]KLU63819.1 streptothricin hydrolase [Desulfosporosinus acididurans]